MRGTEQPPPRDLTSPCVLHARPGLGHEAPGPGGRRWLAGACRFQLCGGHLPTPAPCPSPAPAPPLLPYFPTSLLPAPAPPLAPAPAPGEQPLPFPQDFISLRLKYQEER